jgi:hypothetical protein
VTSESETSLGEPLPPALKCADAGGICQQSILLFLSCQSSELLPQPVVGVQNGFLPVQY